AAPALEVAKPRGQITAERAANPSSGAAGAAEPSGRRPRSLGGPQAPPEPSAAGAEPSARFARAEPKEDGGSAAVRLGWKFIRGLGERAGEALQAARADGPFTSVEDVIRRARLTRAEA